MPLSGTHKLKELDSTTNHHIFTPVLISSPLFATPLSSYLELFHLFVHLLIAVHLLFKLVQSGRRLWNALIT